ncbi:MAG: spore cortex biosynthesis protein YabQ [Ruminococcus sp.]|jgi:spore cortex biosynthesis protein YabQ
MSSELLLFVKSILYGIIMMVGYDVFRILRRVIRHRPFWVILEDLCYWIGSGFFLFSRIYTENSGVLRGYFFAGLILGMILWHYTFSCHLVHFTVKILLLTENTISFFTKRLKFLLLRGKISLYKCFCRFFGKS